MRMRMRMRVRFVKLKIIKDEIIGGFGGLGFGY